jgi:hypothetical protein
LHNLPVNGLWFSEVNIDKIWRKEVNLSVKTPTSIGFDDVPDGEGLKPLECFKLAQWPLQTI